VVAGTSVSETQKILQQEEQVYVTLVKRLGFTLDK